MIGQDIGSVHVSYLRVGKYRAHCDFGLLPDLGVRYSSVSNISPVASTEKNGCNSRFQV